jgi:hypothetical protein
MTKDSPAPAQGTAGSAEFRRYLFRPDSPRITAIKGLDAYAYREAAKRDPFTGGLIRGWKPLQRQEFRGITENGSLRPEVHPFTPARPGEQAPVEPMVAAARALLDASSTSSATTSPSTASPTRSPRGAGSCSVTTARSTAWSSPDAW